MSDEAIARTQWEVEVADEAATAALAFDLVALLKAADLVTLTGDLGSGKTTFARALLRAATGCSWLEAPSPTFTLMQTYEGRDYRIVHADLYRVESERELAELGWEEATEDALTLVEWPERAPCLFGGDRLDVHLRFVAPERGNARKITLTGYGAFASRLAAFTTVREFLRKAGWYDAERAFLRGDASSRAYETLQRANGERAILMISPPRPDGPPIRFGKSYSAIARLAENVRPFVALADGLRARGLSAPRILASDLETGLLIIEDLGRERVVDDKGPIVERYLEAVCVLAHLHAQNLPDVLPIEGADAYHIPPYDLDALLIEVELLVEWYVGHIAHQPITSGARATFVNLWRHALIEITTAQPTWTLRDYHSPNLLWLNDRDGLARIGILDFQDCVMGHPAYDVVSLLQDARVTLPDELEIKLLGHYARLRRDGDATFDMARLARTYAILGAQRATKVLGIFARLAKRDHKPEYLTHLPRVEAYLKKGLRHPALADVKGWYETNLPHLFRAAT
ncbi:MAG: tRNA (adenosine(37)-N6)-threonylcarbamoyltransferase complex ATPase subunit type 1 TsaE [Methylocystis sp.]|nr:tRNA (adenosine(37)-N6)-threonylcarbamoyltransferase complex ATPase subunit type 1 TsaE [Methylocystis sp.]